MLEYLGLVCANFISFSSGHLDENGTQARRVLLALTAGVAEFNQTAHALPLVAWIKRKCKRRKRRNKEKKKHEQPTGGQPREDETYRVWFRHAASRTPPQLEQQKETTTHKI